MKKILVILVVVLLFATCFGPVLASDSSDDSSSSSGSDDSPDSSSDSSSSSGSDDSPDSSSDSSSSSGSDDSPDNSGDSSSSGSDDSPDSSSDSSSSSGSDDSPDSSGSSDSSSGSSPDDSPDSSGSSDSSSRSSSDTSSSRSISDDIRSIQESASEREVELERELSQYSGEQLAQMTDDKEVRVAAYTIQQAAAIPEAGTAAQQLATIGKEVSQVADDSLIQQDRIRERSDLIRFLVGGDRTAASSLDRDADWLQTQITLMEQIYSSPDTPDELKLLIRDQLQVFEAERDHLRAHATSEREDRGLFGSFLGS